MGRQHETRLRKNLPAWLRVLRGERDLDGLQRFRPALPRREVQPGAGPDRFLHDVGQRRGAVHPATGRRVVRPAAHAHWPPDAVHPGRRADWAFDEITRLAKESALKHGKHIPTLIVERSTQTVYTRFTQFPGPYEERAHRLFAAGYSLAEEGEVGNLKQVFFISEGWMSSGVAGKLPDVPPSQDPNRKEVLVISGLQVLGHKTTIRLLEILRNGAGKLIGLLPYYPTRLPLSLPRAEAHKTQLLGALALTGR